VEFTLRDGENRGRKQVVGAGKTCLVPKEYADAVRNHAPQLRRVG
jgi:oxalate decarboxylase/phosphoglucose isomerase-like protein (cupin superfamily)